MSVPNVKRQAGLAALCILAATCTSVSAADISRCEDSTNASHSLQSDYRDLGNGYASYYQESFDFFDTPNSVSGAILIEACASGKIIYAPVYHCVDGAGQECETKSSYDFRDESIAMLDRAAGLEPMTFDALAAGLKKINPEATVESGSEDGVESCACHVAYPRLRGDKQKFSFTTD
ncbi:MAG: hypothetical protein CFE33_08265 [Pseudorhodobacter sp. PARRP1]|nr:MAG: hypothetical protein CFE33_08265 [Pseudorhodobacter sp. PARRP1]